MTKALLSSLLAGLFAATLATTLWAQNAEKVAGLSDRTVRILASFAWANIPDEVSKPDGTKIKVKGVGVDKFMLSLEDTKRIIRIAERSAQAQICGLDKLSQANLGKLMEQEESSKRWTDHQLSWIFWLHRSVVKLRVFDRDGAIAKIKKLGLDPEDKKKALKESKRFRKPECSNKKREEVRRQIDEFVSF